MPDKAPAIRYRFGDLMLDAGQRRLTRGRSPLRISTLTFDFLLALVESWPNVVSYEELLEKVWHGRYVSHETMSQRVLMLRKALSDDADNPRYVEVIRGHGCRLIPAVEAVRGRWSFAGEKARYAFAGGAVALVVASGLWAFALSSLTPPPTGVDARLEALPRADPEVRDLYRRALDFWRDSGTRSLRLTNVDPGIHAYLDRIIRLAPDFAMARGLKARAYADSLIMPFPAGEDLASVRQEQERLARSSADEAFALEPDNPFAHLAMAKLHQYNYRVAEARASYGRALAADPDHIGVLNAAALFHAHAGEHAEAVRLARRAVDLDRSQPVSLYHLGVAHAFSGDIGLAIDALEGAVLLNPAYAAAHVWLAHMERIGGDREASLAALRDAEPLIMLRHPPRPLALALAYAELGMDETAERLAEQFVEASTYWHFGSVSWGLAHLILGAREAALDSFRAAIATRLPDHGSVLEMGVKANVFGSELLEDPELAAIRSRLGFHE